MIGYICGFVECCLYGQMPLEVIDHRRLSTNLYNELI